ncbi:hypothetical protein BJA5080_08323 [Bradyrhizobium diazoefficiens SEMIA 5080]|uniref:Uncharacterized protein n=1 Tax=Bradyrhizobium diazoefficiens SEMIA 5080 TaxID=754504 RepID=A0A837CEM9_9BRAD|nr:hypothetical protein BJA5080_08323 [Bradyrhizobium diazoefficiens SEMIA 5080]
MRLQRRRPACQARRRERRNQFGDHTFVVEAGAVGRPHHHAHRHREHGQRRTVGAYQIISCALAGGYRGMVTRDAVHGQIHREDVRIDIRPPDMQATLRAGIAAFPVLLPIGYAVEAVGVCLLCGTLQPAPDERVYIPIQRRHFRHIRMLGILGREVSGLAQPGIITRHLVDAPTLDPVVIVRAKQDLRLHIPLAKQTVVPFGRVTMLPLHDEGCALLHHRLDGLGSGEFKKCLARTRLVQGQPVLAQSRKANPPQAPASPIRQPLHHRVAGKFRFDSLHRNGGRERDVDMQVIGNRHARHHFHVHQTGVRDSPARRLVIGNPLEAETVTPLLGRRQGQGMRRLSPASPRRHCLAGGRSAQDVGAPRPTGFGRILVDIPIFQ